MLGCDGFWEMEKVSLEKKSFLKESMETLDTSKGKTGIAYEIKEKLQFKNGEEVLKELFDENIAKHP